MLRLNKLYLLFNRVVIKTPKSTRGPRCTFTIDPRCEPNPLCSTFPASIGLKKTSIYLSSSPNFTAQSLKSIRSCIKLRKIVKIKPSTEAWAMRCLKNHAAAIGLTLPAVAASSCPATETALRWRSSGPCAAVTTSIVVDHDNYGHQHRLISPSMPNHHKNTRFPIDPYNTTYAMSIQGPSRQHFTSCYLYNGWKGSKQPMFMGLIRKIGTDRS